VADKSIAENLLGLAASIPRTVLTPPSLQSRFAGSRWQMGMMKASTGLTDASPIAATARIIRAPELPHSCSWQEFDPELTSPWRLAGKPITTEDFSMRLADLGTLSDDREVKQAAQARLSTRGWRLGRE
jgi:hypothetical protein